MRHTPLWSLPALPWCLTRARVSTGARSWANSVLWRGRGWRGHAHLPKLPLSSVNHRSLRQQQRSALGVASAGFESCRYRRQAHPVNRPIAASEVRWGMSTFVYATIFTRLGTMAVAASQTHNPRQTAVPPPARQSYLPRSSQTRDFERTLSPPDDP
jgi:hypothetical protein